MQDRIKEHRNRSPGGGEQGKSKEKNKIKARSRDTRRRRGETGRIWVIASSPPPTASSCAGLAFDWPKLRGEELWVGLGRGGGGREEGRRGRREKQREGGQPDEGGGAVMYCTVRNRQLQFCVPAADDRGGENFSFRLVLTVLTPPCKQRARKL